MLSYVLLYLVKIVTAYMNKLVAFYAFKMEMVHAVGMLAVILIAGRFIGA